MICRKTLQSGERSKVSILEDHKHHRIGTCWNIHLKASRLVDPSTCQITILPGALFLQVCHWRVGTVESSSRKREFRDQDWLISWNGKGGEDFRRISWKILSWPAMKRLKWGMCKWNYKSIQTIESMHQCKYQKFLLNLYEFVCYFKPSPKFFTFCGFKA